ncbi:cytochrome P450 [Streptomyces sp. N35]|uniref:cytochrome P450 n=1 Tax=Streptomyces sp. N35 TaxID=2795730 RepID=UPI0018F4D93B|nr:cytochrome P450 [Streptomyces sp. N35]
MDTEFNLYDPYDRATTLNPFPVYQWLRDHEPAYYNAQRDFWALSRHADVVAAHADPETFSSAGGVTLEGLEKGSGNLVVMDPPEHRDHRKPVNGLFTARRIASLEGFVRSRASALLDAAGDAGEFDVVTDFSLKLPLEVVAELVGIPAELLPQIHELSNRVLARSGPDDPAGLDDMMTAGAELFCLYLDLVRERREQPPRDDAIAVLLTTEVPDTDSGTARRLSDEEVAMRFLELGLAGHETVAKLIPNAVVGLYWYPEQRRHLVDHPEDMPNAVEEFLRWDPPSHLQGRTLTRDVDLHGRTLPAGSRVMLLTAAASHDDRVYEYPELLDIHRKIRKQLAFGYGVHACLGAALARMETRIALEELLKRYPDYEIDGSRAVRKVHSNVRGLSSLPLLTTRTHRSPARSTRAVAAAGS